MTVFKCPRIDWHKFWCRKILFLSIFSVLGYAAEHFLHLWFAGKGAEFALASIVEHTFFEMPFVEGE